jgi:hypothetical protein
MTASRKLPPEIRALKGGLDMVEKAMAKALQSMNNSKVWTMEDIKTADHAAGRFFFEPSSMRFFRSRICPTVYQGPGGIYFVTSEQFMGSQYTAPRMYTVRRFTPVPVDIRTVSVFNRMSKYQAVRAAKKCAEAGQ